MLPVFSLDSLLVDAGKIKNNSFKIRLLFRAEFAKASKELVAVNLEKYLAYLTSGNDECASQNYQNDDEEYYDSDDDEDNIMRGLSNGDGDRFGF